MIMVKIKKKVGLTKTIMSISTTNYEIIMISLKIISTQIIKKKKKQSLTDIKILSQLLGFIWLEWWKSERTENCGRIENILIYLLFIWLEVKKWKDGKSDFV